MHHSYREPLLTVLISRNVGNDAMLQDPECGHRYCWFITGNVGTVSNVFMSHFLTVVLRVVLCKNGAQLEWQFSVCYGDIYY